MHISKAKSKRLSLAARLAILYAITVFSTLLVASGFLYWTLLSHLSEEHELLLATKIFELQDFMENQPVNEKLLHQLIEQEHASFDHSSAIHPSLPHYVYIRVLDIDFNTLVETEYMEHLFSAITFPGPPPNDGKSINMLKTRMDEDHLFLVGAAWASRSEAQQEPVLLQVVLGLAQDENLLSEYQHTLAAVLIIGVLFSSLAGFWITRRGLYPLTNITRTVQRVSAHQLSERIAQAQWPEELSVLATAFDEMLDRLDTSFARLSQFSADLAHELRTPVNNLMGEAEVILSRDRKPEEYRQVIESSLEECARMARMIDELLFLARAENPKTEINKIPLDSRQEIEAVRAFYEGLAEERGIQIICQGGGELYADCNLLRRALGNLLSNALQYTSKKGMVKLIASGTKGSSVEIKVIDTGCGIEAAKLPKIFDRFYRADSARSRNTSGTGLGLAIVKSIMELHGGTVSIVSQVQQGTTVVLVFPEEGEFYNIRN